MSEKSRRNYPFIGRIYTAEQIDNLISSIDLSDYYTKTDIDGMLDIIETAIDAKQDELTAGDNISIINNVISAIVSGGNDYIKLTETTITELKTKDNDYDSIFLLIGYKDSRKQMFLAHKDTYFIDINPIMGNFICKQTTLGYNDFNTSFDITNIYGGDTVTIRNDYIKMSTLNGVDIDSTNIDTYYDSTNQVFTVDMIYRFKDQITASSCILPKNEKQFLASYQGGFYTVTANQFYSVIKNNSSYNTSGDFGTRIQKLSYNITDIIKIYKLEFPTTN